MARNSKYAGKAQGGAYRYAWGDIILIIGGELLITLYWKGYKVRDRERISVRSLRGGKR